jgi:hypothetical protein
MAVWLASNAKRDSADAVVPHHVSIPRIDATGSTELPLPCPAYYAVELTM